MLRSLRVHLNIHNVYCHTG